jgi:excisionase family DNA binding protein
MAEKILIMRSEDLDSIKIELQEIKALVLDGKSKVSDKKDELVTADVAAEMLCISRRTLYTWISVKRILPVTCIGRKRLFRKKDIEALVAHNTINNR